MKTVAILFAVAVMSFPVMAQEQEKRAAEAATQSWLALVDKAEYGASWDQAASLFKSAVTKESWQDAVSKARSSFAGVLSRKLKSAHYTTSLPGAPDGKYVVIQYETSFVNKKSAVETITPMLDKDGKWRVSGYFIR
jgi:hypothetical protein